MLDRIDLAIESGSRWAVVGSSGAGKTTLLRIIAGLDEPDAGCLEREPAPVARRPGAVGMVFQDLGLWPHLSARQHLEYVLAGRRDDRRARAEQLLAEVRLPPSTWSRRPAELSGGEAQRLAMARALAGEPALLLLDEALAQVHQALRDELTQLLSEVVGKRRATLISVTHSWLDLPLICDSVAVLVGGRIAQSGTLADVYQRPASPEVARLTGPCHACPVTWFEQGRVEARRDEAGWQAVLDDGEILVRPQQVAIIAPRGLNRWLVQEETPQWGGWRLRLRGSDESQWTIACSARPGLGQAIGLAIDGTATALRLPDRCVRTR